MRATADLRENRRQHENLQALQYKTINACAVYEGELVTSNRFTGEMTFDETKRTADKIVGYAA